MTTEYTSIKIPKTLSVKIKKIIEREGFRSVSEFVLDSTRRRIDEITNKKIKPA